MRFIEIVLFLCTLNGLSFGATINRPDDLGPTCGYESCPKADPQKLNIHLVAHTHNDVGWLKTVDEYYFGRKQKIQVAHVEKIINSVVDALEKDPARKFIYVEMAFLWKWWLRQTEEKRELVKKLINEGRLEIIGGGWSMNDEAVTHYQSMIDQYTWGFRRLNDTFGYCARPKIGWQIDPFGHSREQASMFAQLGFDGLLFGRLHYQEKVQRLKNETAEFIWKASPTLGKAADLFTTVLYNVYYPPPHFCFDDQCHDTKLVTDDNADERVDEFLEFVNILAKGYRTNNVLITMGGDFHYHMANKWFYNMDALIRHVNKRNGSNYNAFYSTPSCYLKSLNDLKFKWPVKTDDFFPYASDPHKYWTGYYSSRPAIKYFERLGNNFLQIVKQLSVLSNEPDNEKLQLFREAMGVMQHHDAVTGTEKQRVAEDYAKILHQSIKNGEDLTATALNKLITKKRPSVKAKFNTCLLLNISVCHHTTNNKKFVVTVYNPTSQPLTTFVSLPVESAGYSVRDYRGKEMEVQLVPIPETVKNIPGRISNATKELIFKAANIAPFGYQSFYVNQTTVVKNDLIKIKKVQRATTEFYNVSITKNGNLLLQPLDKHKPSISLRYQYYESSDSGAYIFKPLDDIATDMEAIKTFQIIDGPLVQEIHLFVNKWASMVLRYYKNTNYLINNWLVGPIPVDDEIGKEVIVRYSTPLENKGVFYTDSNGREMLERKLNYQPSWNLELEEPVSGNYYPVPSKIAIVNEKHSHRFAVLTDRAQGGTSLNEGEIELMLHRRLIVDDDFGVSEVLDEYAYDEGLVVRGQHFILLQELENVDQAILAEKELAIQLTLRPGIFITPLLDSFDEHSEYYNMKSDGLINKLPRNVHILTLEPWKDGEVLLRLEHVFEKGESLKYSTSVQIDLKDLFLGFTVQAVRETVLGANQWINENVRLKWKSEIDEIPVKTTRNSSEKLDDSLVIDLRPMQIRTFIIQLVPTVKSTN